MNLCKEFEDLILTDYVDGEIDNSTRARIDAHLTICSHCRGLKEDVEKQLGTPLNQASRREVPPDLWLAIKDKIQEKKTVPAATRIKDLIDRLLGPVTWPRVSVALASFTILIFVASGFHNYQLKRQAREKEQGEYLIYLLAPTTLAESDATEPMPIEKYFL